MHFAQVLCVKAHLEDFSPYNCNCYCESVCYSIHRSVLCPALTLHNELVMMTISGVVVDDDDYGSRLACTLFILKVVLGRALYAYMLIWTHFTWEILG